jgi:hypothetical protein
MRRKGGGFTRAATPATSGRNALFSSCKQQQQQEQHHTHNYSSISAALAGHNDVMVTGHIMVA